MTTWVYLASDARANEADTLRFAVEDHVLARTARNKDGRLIANVSRLKPGDEILLAYRVKGPLVARVRATIGPPTSPVAGTQAIERMSGHHAAALVTAGYPPLPDGTVEVMHLADVREVEIPLTGEYGARNAIQRLKADDTVPSTTPTTREPTLRAKTPTAKPPVTPSASPVMLPRSPTTAFDAYMMVDWSSSSVPCTGADSVWIACGEREGSTLREHWENPRTRHEALAAIRRTLLRWVLQGRRALVGLDFAFGYPQGFARALGLQGIPWQAVLAHFGRHVTDDIRNVHNRDGFAAACNVRISEGPGPFWGCHNAAAGPNLTTKRVGVFTFPHLGLNEWRETDRRVRGAQSVWKLNQGVAVGGQTILGLKYLHDLRYESDSRVAAALRLWPFETGWTPTDQLVVCEIFPSAVFCDISLGAVKDLAQVRSCVRAAAREDASGGLGQHLGSRSRNDDRAVIAEEGWILFA
jgi:hypothetical protein